MGLNLKTKYSKRFLLFIIGIFLISIAYNVFITTNKLVPGGVGGIAVIVNNIFGIDNSLFMLVINLLLLVISYYLLGKEKTTKTILGSLLLPIFIGLTEHINIWLEIDSTQILFSSIFGGIIFGFGVGLVFKAGFTTGGTDIINHIISKYAKISVGKSMLLIDGIIVLSSGFYFGINNMMYSIIMLYIISLISDRVVLGISDSKAFYIITEQEEKVKDFIINELGQKVTILKAQGGFKREKENVLMVVLPTKDYYKLKEGVKVIDKEAFYIITDTYEVFKGE